MDDCITNYWASQVRKQVVKGNLDEVRNILNRQTKIQRKKISDFKILGSSILHKSIEFDRFEIVQYLIEECDANPNFLSDSKSTPIEIACSNGNVDLLMYLCQHGADVHRKNDVEQTYLMQFIQNPQICEYLISKGVDVNAIHFDSRRPALFYAIDDLCLRSVELLITNGADINQKFHRGLTPVGIACLNGELELLEYLISRNADIHAVDDKGCSYLIRSMDEPEVCKLLLANGAKINHVSNDNKTALSFSAIYGEVDTMKILLSKGADVNIPDKDGKTALHHAVEVNFFEGVKLLVKYGADVNHKNSDGLGSLQVAATLNHPHIVNYLAKNIQIPVTAVIDGHELLAAETFKLFEFKVGKDLILKAMKLRESENMVKKATTIVNDIFTIDNREPEINKLEHMRSDLDRKVESIKEITKDKGECHQAIAKAYEEFYKDFNKCVQIDIYMLKENDKWNMLKQAVLIQARILGPYSKAVFDTLKKMNLFKEKQNDEGLRVKRFMVEICLRVISEDPSQRCCKYISDQFSEEIYRVTKEYLLCSLKLDIKSMQVLDVVYMLNTYIQCFQHAFYFHRKWIGNDAETMYRSTPVFLKITALTIYRLFMVSQQDNLKTVKDLLHQLMNVERYGKKMVKNIHQIYHAVTDDDDDYDECYFRGLSTPAMLTFCKAIEEEGMEINLINGYGCTILHYILILLIKFFKYDEYGCCYYDYDRRKRKELRHKDDDPSQTAELMEYLLSRGIHLETKNKNGESIIGLIRQLPENYRRDYVCYRKELSLQCLTAKVIVKERIPFKKLLPKQIVHFVQIHSGGPQFCWNNYPHSTWISSKQRMADLLSYKDKF